MTHALHRWRKEFPIVSKKTYLASHSLGAVPRQTAQSLKTYYEEWAALGIEAWDGPWWQAVLDFGADLEAILHAPPGTVVPLPNATRAMAAVASSLDYRGRRNRILMTDLEFTTFYPFWQRQKALGAEIVVVRSGGGLGVPVRDLVAAIDDRTLLVATCHAYFRSAALQDLGALVKAAHERGAYVLGDGYQVVGTVPVDVAKLGIDFYVGGSHKWLCGGAGAGYLYVRKELQAQLEPRLTGWFGLAEPFAYTPGTSEGAMHSGVLRLLDGTPNVPGLYAAREGIRIVRKVGVEAIRKVSKQLTERLIRGAEAADLTLKSPRRFEERSGMVCLDFAGAQGAVEELGRQGIIVDWRPDCGVRVSPHFYNDEADVDRFLDALARFRGAKISPRKRVRAKATA